MIGKYGYEAPLGVYYVATQDASWKMVTDFIPTEEFHKLDIHRYALKPLGINFQMGGILLTMGQTAHIMTIHRTHENFTERERGIMNVLHPHLVTSYVNALAYTKARDSAEQIRAAIDMAPGAYGYFGRDGKMVWLQNKAETWLHEFFPDDVKTAEKIPHRVNQLLQESFARQHYPQQLEQVRGNEVLVVCLGGSPVGGIILRLERKLAKPLSHFRPLPQITDRENEVLRWMVEGKRNGEIGIILKISERTVESHVAQILAKLKVENRATAIIRAMEFSAATHMATMSPTW